MKNLSLFVLIAGLVACGDDAKKSAATNNVSNNVSNNVTSNNTANNTPNNLTGAEVATELWAMLCDSTFECPSPDLLAFVGRYPSAAACKAAEPPAFVNFPNFDEVQARGNATFNSAKAQTCLAKWRSTICELSFATPPPECDDVFVGSLPEGGACIDGSECADGRDCQRDSGVCEGTCENNCGEFNCLNSEFCSQTGCVELGAIGADCQDFDECTTGLFCIASVCSTGNSTAAGGECQLNGECSGDQTCLNSECTAFNPPTAGQPCTLGETSTFCAPGSVCTDLVLGDNQLDGTCGPPKKAGGECRVFYECEVGLTCDAPDFLTPGVCTALRANGAACTSQFDCESGACENDLCEPPATCQ